VFLKGGLVCKLQTRTSVIAATNPKGKYDFQQNLSVNTAIASPLLSRFDLILVLLDDQDSDWDRRVSDHILGGILNHEEDENIWSLPLLRAYFSYVKVIQPELTPESKLVLSAYYKRQRQCDTNNAARTTIRLLESLIRISQAHARLMFRRQILLQDAVMAVLLMEASMQTAALTGVSSALHSSFHEDPDREYIEQEERILKSLHLLHLLSSPFSSHSKDSQQTNPISSNALFSPIENQRLVQQRIHRTPPTTTERSMLSQMGSVNAFYEQEERENHQSDEDIEDHFDDLDVDSDFRLLDSVSREKHTEMDANQHLQRFQSGPTSYDNVYPSQVLTSVPKDMRIRDTEQVASSSVCSNSSTRSVIDDSTVDDLELEDENIPLSCSLKERERDSFIAPPTLPVLSNSTPKTYDERMHHLDSFSSEVPVSEETHVTSRGLGIPSIPQKLSIPFTKDPLTIAMSSSSSSSSSNSMENQSTNFLERFSSRTSLETLLEGNDANALDLEDEDDATLFKYSGSTWKDPPETTSKESNSSRMEYSKRISNESQRNGNDWISWNQRSMLNSSSSMNSTDPIGVISKFPEKSSMKHSHHLPPIYPPTGHSILFKQPQPDKQSASSSSLDGTDMSSLRLNVSPIGHLQNENFPPNNYNHSVDQSKSCHFVGDVMDRESFSFSSDPASVGEIGISMFRSTRKHIPFEE